jgi:hypothetical protein
MNLRAPDWVLGNRAAALLSSIPIRGFRAERDQWLVEIPLRSYILITPTLKRCNETTKNTGKVHSVLTGRMDERSCGRLRESAAGTPVTLAGPGAIIALAYSHITI